MSAVIRLAHHERTFLILKANQKLSHTTFIKVTTAQLLLHSYSGASNSCSLRLR